MAYLPTNNPTYTLDSIYNIDNKQNALYTYRHLINNPNAGAGLSLWKLKNQIVIEAHNRHLLSDKDYEIHNSKSLRVLNNLDINSLNNLANKYNLNKNVTNKYNIALTLYRHGIGFPDLMYARSNEPEMVTGTIPYQLKPGEIREGVYDRSGKVDKDETEYADPIPENPYTYLPARILRIIAQDRDIAIPGNKHQLVLANILYNYDQVLPEWSTQARENPQTRYELYYAGGAVGIDMNKITTNGMSDVLLRKLVDYGKIILPNRNTLPKRIQYKQYPNKTPLDFPIAYDLSKDEAYILKPINIGFPFSIFGVHKTREETVGYMAEIAVYPPNISSQQYQTIVDAPASTKYILKTLLEQKYKTDDVMLLDDNHLLFLISRGYILPDIKLEENKKRYEVIKNYDRVLLVKLKQLYGIAQQENKTAEYTIASEKPNPIEPLIVNYFLTINNKEKLTKEYSKAVGMVIPPTVQNKSGYFWHNIHRYGKIFTRSPTIGPLDKNLLSVDLLTNNEVKTLLKNYTDNEIFTYTGVYLPYTSRNDLINKVISVRGDSKFFVPTVRACSNEDTVTTFDDTADTKIFIVAYGTMFEYFCYNLEDFEESFREFVIEGLEGLGEGLGDREERNQTVFRFRKPNQPDQDFTNQEIQDLVLLLEQYTHIPGVNRMIEHLRNGLRRTRETTQYDITVLQTFTTLPTNDKPLIRDWLKQLFYTGMYMRRWKGPDNPYPLTRAETQGPDPNVKVNEEITILGYYPTMKDKDGYSGIMAKLSEAGQNFVNNLRAVEYLLNEVDVRTPQQQTRTIGFYLDRVRTGNMCIRMASTLFIGTGSYYLGIIFNEDIPNFDPTRLERVV